MDAQKVDMFIIANGKFFETHMISVLREELLAADDSKWIAIQSIEYKDPTTMLLISLFGGHFGIDRFVVGDVGIGVAKLLTCGGLWIWTIVDFFLIMGVAREKNLEKIHRVLANYDSKTV